MPSSNPSIVLGKVVGRDITPKCLKQLGCSIELGSAKSTFLPNTVRPRELLVLLFIELFIGDVPIAKDKHGTFLGFGLWA